MNLLQWEFGVLPTKVLKEDKAEYIQALIDSREQEDINIFLDCMARHHCQHLASDIDQFTRTVMAEVADKNDLKQEMVDKWSIKPSLAEKMVDILCFMADKEEITTGDIVAHFGFTDTIEFLGIWETLHNPNFNPLEFEGFRKEAGLNAFTLSPTRWIEK